MALPPGFLDELRSRTSIARIVGRKVTWDLRKSNQGKGDWWGPCPFHQEKTASFHVDDRQGYYYCFGCHAKGDAITFLREAEGLSFMEAVEEAARDAGMEVPAQDPRAAAQAKVRATLSDVMEEAVRHFRQQLSSAAAREARAYLAGRGLTEAALERFEIGFAPPGWDGLRSALTQKGADIEQLLACGLVRPSDKGRAPYDTFRDRIVFPIRDARGRAIAFGGRAMDPADSAKYLNSPDTELFDKGRTLYNHGPARAAAGKGAPLIVAEGYMDVIALAEAGFGAAVAPLGTAVTESQLKMLWQIHPEPIVALDGDTAGLRAGERLMDLALPLIEAGQSLRFALLPEGQDPDDLIRAGGPEAMQAALVAARPIVDLLWARETRGRVLDSPERRAALDRTLRQAVARIGDPSIRSHTAQALREKRAALFGLNEAPRGAPAARYGGPRNGKWAAPPATPMPSTRAAAQLGRDLPPEHLREAVILATCMATPPMIEEFADRLEETEFLGPGHAEIAAALLNCDVLGTPEQVRSALEQRIAPHALERLLAPRHVQLSPGLRRAGDLEIARNCLTSEFARLDADRGLAREVAEAMMHLGRAAARAPYGEAAETHAVQAAEDPAPYRAGPDESDGEGTTHPDPMAWRLSEAARARTRAERQLENDHTEFDVAENGASVDRQEKNAFDALLRSIGHTGQSKRRANRPADVTKQDDQDPASPDKDD